MIIWGCCLFVDLHRVYSWNNNKKWFNLLHLKRDKYFEKTNSIITFHILLSKLIYLILHNWTTFIVSNLSNITTPISPDVNRKWGTFDQLSKEKVLPGCFLYPPLRMFSSFASSHSNHYNKAVTKKMKTDIAIFQGEVKSVSISFLFNFWFHAPTHVKVI